MLLFYIRHGEPIYNPDSLTELGKRQAEAVAKRLARFGVDEIYASSSPRALQTAQPTSEMTHKEITALDWCHESRAWSDTAEIDENGKRVNWLYGHEEIRKLFVTPQMASLGKNWFEHEAFRDKPYKDGFDRIARDSYDFLGKLGYEHDEKICAYRAVNPNEKRIALFAHEGFGMAFMSALLDIPYPMYCTHFMFEQSSVTTLKFDGDDVVVPRMLQLSNDSHLYAENLPTLYNGEIRF